MVYVTGDTAINQDFFDLTDQRTPWVFAFVLGLSFLLLMVAFRSIVVPAKAIIMNLLSVGAAYGLIVLVFQKGYGADFFGFTEVPTIEAWLPLFLFCVLFGLSMDYQVFLLSRIREQYDRTGNNTEAVAQGLQKTARLITGAAAIMVAVFLGFSLGQTILIAADGVRSGGGDCHRRDHRSFDFGPGHDALAGQLELVPAFLARMAARSAYRRHATTSGRHSTRGPRRDR